MTDTNRAFCQKCRAIVSCEHVLREGRVYLRKTCPACGVTESLLSSDPAGWQAKRDLWEYQPTAAKDCSLHCDRCARPHEPTIVFLDVTNHCNMFCPICIANIKGMGFDFHPPMAYFEKIFQALGQLNPRPMVQLFGGEPTLREDLQEIIGLGRRYGVKSRIVTNGLKLADEEYCRKLCESGARFRLALDGRHPDVYRRMRKNPGALDKKLKALANIKKYSHRKHALLCCAARHINEDYIGDLIDCCHEYREVIDSLGLLPLTETWEAGTFESDVQTTREDAERMVQNSVADGAVEFIPAGLLHSLRRARMFWLSKPSTASESLMFGGVHPDCETLTLLVSDGQRYRSISHYLKMPLGRLAHEMRARAQKLDPLLARLNPANRWDHLRGRHAIVRTFAPLALRAISLRKVFRGNPIGVTLRFLGGLLRGRKAADLARQYFNLSQILRVAILPFEEFHSIDAARIENCKAVFAYEDVEDGLVKFIPACSWGSVYRNDVLRKIAGKYGSAARKADESAAPHALPPEAGAVMGDKPAAAMPM